MGLIEVASAKSVWRGMEYYGNKKVCELKHSCNSYSKRVDYIRQSTLGFNDLRNDICKKEYKYFLHQFDK